MGPVLINIIKYGKLIIQLGPIVYQGIVWGKKIYKEVRKKKSGNQAILMAESGKRGARYSRKQVKKLLTTNG